MLLFSVLLPSNAQGLAGTVTGTVVSRIGREPIDNALVQIYSEGQEIWSTKTDVAGRFWIVNVANGNYMLSFSADGYAPSMVNIVVEGYEKDLRYISLLPLNADSDELDASNFSELDMDDSGYNDNPTILFGSNDPYTSIAGYGFSSIRYLNRGYSSETQDVYLAGVRLNDAMTGFSPYALWSGLNEATRSKDTSIGLETVDYVNLHGTGTTYNDAMECAAVRRVFGESVPCSSTKPLTGHCLGAAGAIEAALCWIALKRGRGLPPHCAAPVDAVLAPFPIPQVGDDRPLRTILSNSFAFGGSNASVILGSGV